MTNVLRSLRGRCLALIVIGTSLTACTTTLFSPGPRPRELSAAWVDLSKATPTDTSFWILSPNGDDGSRRVHRDSSGAWRSTTAHFGMWYTQGSLADTAARLCFQKRARFGASCIPFLLDTIRANRGTYRRLTLRGYRGTHSTGDRVLIEVLP
jgi:hypothetical protein